MLTRRVIKQATYAALFAGIVLVVGLVVFFAVAQPAPTPVPSPSPTPRYQALLVERVDVVRHEGAVDVVARLRNPNPRAGIPALNVNFVLQNAAGEAVTTTPVVSYILPGSLQYLVALNVPVAEAVASVRVDLPAEPQFVDLPDSLQVPSFNVFLRHRSHKDVGGALVEQQVGLVRNTSTFNFQRVELVALATDATDTVVGISHTFVGELKVGEQREFTVQWPAPGVTTTAVTTLPTTNIFREENIIRTIGDPGSLR